VWTGSKWVGKPVKYGYTYLVITCSFDFILKVAVKQQHEQ
jgi:hypothetical protein